MDKILSARVDENTLIQISRLSRGLKISKKKVIENAIKDYVARIERNRDTNAIIETFGAWLRDESVDETIRTGRDTMRKSMKRHQS